MEVHVEQIVYNFEYVLEILATLFYAISGVRLAAYKNFDWYGAYTIGFITAFGGGTMRDLFLKATPFWMLDPWYVVATIAGFIIVMVFRKKLVRIEGTFYIFDAVGLGLFACVGIFKTLSLGFPMWVALIMGIVTGAMGGVLRDIFINEEPLIFRKEIYATACIAGGVIYWISSLIGLPSELCQLLCALSIIALRFFAVKHNLSFPVMKK
jgi:uncharacterized membrane protein YeiH